MKRNRTAVSIALACAGAVGLGLVSTSLSRALATGEDPDDLNFALAQDDEDSQEPLVLTVDDDAKSQENAPQDDDAPQAPPVEELPLDALQKDDAPAALDLSIPDEPLNEEEMRALSKQPLFREFTNIIDETAPLPTEIDVESLDVPGAQLMIPAAPQEDFGATPQTAPGRLDPKLEKLLDETLAIAEVDLDRYTLTPQQRQTLEALDAEIGRVWPMWIDAEINRNVVGRRERDWRQNDFTRFSTAAAPTIDAPAADWALAIDEPFWFQVVDLISGETFYTKAGDFEQLDSTGSIALLREERRYALALEEGRVAPTGRAMRVKILKDGRIQGVDASGRLVTDVNLGQIPLFMFQNPARLDSKDGVFFTPTPYSGAPQRASLTASTKIGVTQHALTLSNGKPEELLARIGVLCKSKARLFELITHSTIPAKTGSVARGASGKGIDAALDPPQTEPEKPEVETIPTPATDDASGSEETEFTIPDESTELILPEALLNKS